MNARIQEIIAKLTLNPPAPVNLVKDVEAKLGVVFPREYAEFINKHNGGEGSIGENSYLILWPLEELVPLNEAYSVNSFVPGLLFIGSNGGGSAYAFDRRDKSMPIVEVSFIGMNLDEVRLCGHTFSEFLERLYHQNGLH